MLQEEFSLREAQQRRDERVQCLKREGQCKEKEKKKQAAVSVKREGKAVMEETVAYDFARKANGKSWPW